MRNPRTLFAAFACLLFALLAFAVRVNGQDDACFAKVTNITVLQLNANASADGVAMANALVLQSFRYQGAIGRPEYALYINEAEPVEQRQYWLAFPDRANRRNMVLMRYSHRRLFQTFEVIGTLPDGSPDYLHNHPDCLSGTIPRTDIEALLVGAQARPTVAALVPPSAEAMERHRLRLLQLDAKIACARVEAWAVNHATDDGLADAQAACTAALDAVLTGGA